MMKTVCLWIYPMPSPYDQYCFMNGAGHAAQAGRLEQKHRQRGCPKRFARNPSRVCGLQHYAPSKSAAPYCGDAIMAVIANNCDDFIGGIL